MPTTEQYLGPNNKRARNDGLPAVVVAMPRTGSTTRLTSSREAFKTERNGPAIVLKGIAVAPLLYARETQCTPRAFANDQRKRSLPWLLGDASAPPDGACVLDNAGFTKRDWPFDERLAAAAAAVQKGASLCGADRSVGRFPPET